MVGDRLKARSTIHAARALGRSSTDGQWLAFRHTIVGRTRTRVYRIGGESVDDASVESALKTLRTRFLPTARGNVPSMTISALRSFSDNGIWLRIRRSASARVRPFRFFRRVICVLWSAVTTMILSTRLSIPASKSRGRHRSPPRLDLFLLLLWSDVVVLGRHGGG